MTFRVLHHNNCFDGACSAAVFTKLHQERLGGADAYEYCGLAHGPAGELAETIFGPGENAIVDFKYSQSPRLTWWFDHHQSAFANPALRAHFDARQIEAAAGRVPQTQFLDEQAVSCTGFIARVGKERFGFDTTGLDELLHWADIVDGARFASPEAAVAMREPAMKLTLAIENADSPDFIPRIIPLLTKQPLAAIIEQPFIAERIQPLLERHFGMVDSVRERAQLDRGTILLDMTDREIEGFNKFIPYYLFPEAVYTVAVTRSSTRVKVSVGTSPWTTLPVAELANIALICERSGGGGHARVGAISMGREAVAEGLALAASIAAELRDGTAELRHGQR